MTDLPRLPLTADEFANVAAPEGTRLELWEGNLVVMAAAQMWWHSATARRIANLHEKWGREVGTEVGVVLARRDVPVPDVIVLHDRVKTPRRSQFPAEEVACVVEVVSPESVDRDMRFKPAKYAAARIPEFWLVTEHPDEPFDAQVEIYKLTPEGGYVVAERSRLTDLEQR